jgi:hypothetical protein
MTQGQMEAEAIKRFGPDPLAWRFVCPSCGHIASIRDWKNVGAPPNAAGFSCVGRWNGSKQKMLTKKGGPCNYAGGGLFQLNPQPIVDETGEELGRCFALAEAGQ